MCTGFTSFWLWEIEEIFLRKLSVGSAFSLRSPVKDFCYVVCTYVLREAFHLHGGGVVWQNHKTFSHESWKFLLLYSHGFAAASFFWSSIQAHWVQAPIWSSILIFVHSTIWRDFSKRLRSHCISSRLSRLQWIEKSPPNQIHDIHFLPFAAFSGQRPAHLKTTKRRRRRYLAPMMMSKRIPKIM